MIYAPAISIDNAVKQMIRSTGEFMPVSGRTTASPLLFVPQPSDISIV